MKDSTNIVFDIAKPDNFWCCDPYILLLYLWGKLPAIPGIESQLLFINNGTEGIIPTAFGPANQQRDDHMIIVKREQGPPSQPVQDAIISQFMQDFNDDKFIQLITQMKYIVTTKSTTSPVKQELFNIITNINIACTPLSTETKIQALKCWFSNAITGPYCITRSLDVVTSNLKLNQGAIECDSTTKIRSKLNIDGFWKFSIQYLNLIDNKYYVINGKQSDDLNFPQDIAIFDYVGIREPANKYDEVPEQIIHRFQVTYLTGKDKIDDNMIQGLLVTNNQTQRFRIKLIYGKNVSRGIHSNLMTIINGQRFNDWCVETGLEIWNGRDEQTKISDYRLLKLHLKQSQNDNHKLQQEILALKQHVMELQTNNKNNNQINAKK